MVVRRAITAGLLSGIIITVAGIYPLVGLVAPNVLHGWDSPIANQAAHVGLLVGSVFIGITAFFLGGFWAVPRRPEKGWQTGLRAGMLAGGTAGAGCYITLVAPMNALIAYGQITPHLPNLAAVMPLPAEVLLNYVAAFESFLFSLELTLMVFAFSWGFIGSLAGWRRGENEGPANPDLFTLIESGSHPRKWFSGEELSLQIGLRTGVVIGVLALVTTFGWFYAGLAQNLEAFESIVRSSRTGMIIGPVTQVLSVLSPLLTFALLIFGIVIVALIKNPPDRNASRSKAVFLAAVIISFFLSSLGLRIFYFNLGLTPFLLSQAISDNLFEMNPSMLQLQQVLGTFTVPAAIVATTLLIAWSLIFIAVLFGLFLGGLQALISVTLVPLIVKRPVDQAVVLQKRLQKRPNDLLPILYGLKTNRSEAYAILAHFSVRTFKRSTPDISRLGAAFHSLSSEATKEIRIKAVAAIQNILQEQNGWRWSADFGIVYHLLNEVLKARTLDRILLIQLPNKKQTASLPSRMVQSMQHLTLIINELQKISKVEDLPTRLIFLENSLTAIRDAQRFVESALGQGIGTAVTMSQRVAFLDVLDQLQGIVLVSTKRLKGRADLVSSLQNQKCVQCSPMPLTFQIRNRGLNVAQEVRLRVLPGEQYVPKEGEAEIEILSPGEVQQITRSIIPQDDLSRLRLEWEILYDDAVVDDRRLLFADVLEFEDPQSSFTRVFPIPYVTGTPLKTDDVFVGREDVFRFIQENLIGAHQNNVIILHGQRRTGKTSVLYRLGRMMSETHIGVLIDMQGKPARGEADFLFSIADDIVFALEDEGIEVALPDRADFSEAPEFYFLSRFLRNLYPQLGERNLLMMFDEFEEIQRRVDSGRLEPEIFQYLRNLMQHEDKLDFVFSGTHRLEDLSADYWSILFNIAAYKPITFLEPGEVQRLMIAPVTQFGIEYDPLAVDRIMQVTAGHPYFTQLVLHEMMVHHNENGRSYLNTADVEKALIRILERGQAHFKHIWAESSTDEQLILMGMAELSPDGNLVALQDLQALLSERGHESATIWQEELHSLVSREILTGGNGNSTSYRFKVDLIRLWIQRTTPVL